MRDKNALANFERRIHMATSQKQVNDNLRALWTKDIMSYIGAKYDSDVCQTAAGTFMFPVVDESGEDRWVKVSVIIPKDANEADGTDGYSLQHEYELKQEAAAERKAAAAAKAEAARAKAAAKADAKAEQ